MRRSIPLFLASLVCATWFVACGSDDSGQSASEPQQDAAAGAAGTSGGGGGTATGGTAGASGSANPSGGTGGMEAGAVVTDVTGTPECDAWCAKYAECTGSQCPSTKCEVPTGQCADSYKDYLACEANASWSCGSDGFGIVSNCEEDASNCPPGTIVEEGGSEVDAGATVSCDPEAGDDACYQCMKNQCCSGYIGFFSHPDHEALLSCLDTCPTMTCVENICVHDYSGAWDAMTELTDCLDTGCSVCL